MKPHILLVDDEEVSNFLAMRHIELVGAGARIDSANNGEQALDLIHALYQKHLALPDIIFLDINMPLMDGFEFMKVFSQLSLPDQEKVKIIVTSSSTNPGDVATAKELGANGFITKPMTLGFLRTFFESLKTNSLVGFVTN